jgi:hypothetical protein
MGYFIDIILPLVIIVGAVGFVCYLFGGFPIVTQYTYNESVIMKFNDKYHDQYKFYVRSGELQYFIVNDTYYKVRLNKSYITTITHLDASIGSKWANTSIISNVVDMEG